MAKQKEEVTELKEKVLYVNRCVKVVKGGRKFSFSALVLVGDQNGIVGVGFAKANEVADAIKKATEIARKNTFSFEMENTTIPHEMIMEWDGTKIILKPAKEGTGIIAGSKVRSVLEIAGIKDVVAKIIGSNNPLNQVQATVRALKGLKNRNDMLKLRGVV